MLQSMYITVMLALFILCRPITNRSNFDTKFTKYSIAMLRRHFPIKVMGNQNEIRGKQLIVMIAVKSVLKTETFGPSWLEVPC